MMLSKKLLLAVAAIFTICLYSRTLIANTYAIVALPVLWGDGMRDFLISKHRDDFDVTFEKYDKFQQSAEPEYEDKVPKVLHHISLGSGRRGDGWLGAREKCLEYHQGWEAILWTDENAGKFVEEKFPHMKAMWDGYRFPIQKIDALRYMVLYEYGGTVLDMDLECRRSLGPLRRFSFVAPAAHPVGFSNGFLMAEKRHPFVAELVKNLKPFNRFWFFLPYPTVMFSTGCHYASAIHALQPMRNTLRILGGTFQNRNLHRLNGHVVTPLFEHLGSGSWHSFDAALINMIGHSHFPTQLLFFVAGAACAVFVGCAYLQRRKKNRSLPKADEEITIKTA